MRPFSEVNVLCGPGNRGHQAKARASREAGSGGSRSHSHDLTNGQRIRGLGRWVSWLQPVTPEIPKTGPGKIRQERGERTSASPGSAVTLPGVWLPDRQRVGKGWQQSAEARVPEATWGGAEHRATRHPDEARVGDGVRRAGLVAGGRLAGPRPSTAERQTHPPRVPQPPRSVPGACGWVNRPVRTRMPGGVGGGASNGPAYPIVGRYRRARSAMI